MDLETVVFLIWNHIAKNIRIGCEMKKYGKIFELLILSVSNYKTGFYCLEQFLYKTLYKQIINVRHVFKLDQYSILKHCYGHL